jgi:hypothetical protein
VHENEVLEFTEGQSRCLTVFQGQVAVCRLAKAQYEEAYRELARHQLQEPPQSLQDLQREWIQRRDDLSNLVTFLLQHYQRSAESVRFMSEALSDQGVEAHISFTEIEDADLAGEESHPMRITRTGRHVAWSNGGRYALE